MAQRKLSTEKKLIDSENRVMVAKRGGRDRERQGIWG